jgi:hypothetical protein
MNHTPEPRPWSVDGRSIVDADNNRVALVAADADLVSARLIAAAPRLLTALEELLWSIEAFNGPNGAYCQDVRVFEARAAIAKARGES